MPPILATLNPQMLLIALIGSGVLRMDRQIKSLSRPGGGGHRHLLSP